MGSHLTSKLGPCSSPPVVQLKRACVDPDLSRKKVLVISGPTAVGKSSLALMIAQSIGGEIVSADSMQVYRGMDIGTAKPTMAERKQVLHHLIDSRDLDEAYNVVEFYHEAHSAIREIFDRGGVPIIVGGTGFYIHALLYGPPSGPPSDPALRKHLEREIDTCGIEAMYEKLKALDPCYAASITAGDRHKIVRALEIMTLSPQRVSSLTPLPNLASLYDFKCWFLYRSKETLYDRIEVRCDEMIAAGFIDEVKRLKQEHLENNITARQAIGYRQCLDYLQSPQQQTDWDTFVSSFKQASRRYAKRQFTWFRKELLFRWLNRDEIPIEHAIELMIRDYELG